MRDVFYGKLGDWSKSSVVARMDPVFDSLLEGLQNSADPKEQFKVMVQCYIFAAFLIESTANFNLRTTIGQNRSFETAEEMFQAVEQLRLERKIDFLRGLLAAGNSPLKIDLPSGWREDLAKISGMRNRVAHYKDSPTPVPKDFAEKMKQFPKVKDALDALLPNVKIYDELIAHKVEDVRSKARILGKAIDVMCGTR